VLIENPNLKGPESQAEIPDRDPVAAEAAFRVLAKSGWRKVTASKSASSEPDKK
jgi:hypothetical protein